METLNEWLEENNDNIIIDGFMTKRSYYKNIPNNNLIVKVIIENERINYKKNN